MNADEIPIEETVKLDRNYPRVSERYFTEYYFIPNEKSKSGCNENGSDDKGSENCHSENSTLDDDAEVATKEHAINEGKNKDDDSSLRDGLEHTCVLLHSNKLCLLTLSHYHPVLAERKEIAKINFDVGKFNRLENQVSGKGKRGAQAIGPKSPVCIITCSDGSVYTVLAGVNGKLVEVNERLDTNPQLLSESPREEGYLAIVLPPLRNGNALLNKLFSKAQYERRIKPSVEGLI